MAVGENAFWQFNENRAKAGYKSAWLIKFPNKDKYELVALTDSVPYPFGDTETFDVNPLQSPVIGKVKGKTSMESVDVPVYHHRDNAYRFMKIGDQVVDFMSINDEMVAYKYSGSVEYKPDTAEADVNMATVTLTPIAGSKTPVLDARNEIIETLCLAGVIPETISTGLAIDFAVKQSGVTPTFEVKKIAPSTNEESLAVSTTDYTVDGNKISFVTTGLFAVTISATGYASWTTTVYVKSAV